MTCSASSRVGTRMRERVAAREGSEASKDYENKADVRFVLEASECMRQVRVINKKACTPLAINIF